MNILNCEWGLPWTMMMISYHHHDENQWASMSKKLFEYKLERKKLEERKETKKKTQRWEVGIEGKKISNSTWTISWNTAQYP